MAVVDIHTHVYPRVSGITQGQPMAGIGLGRVKIGNRTVQFLPPSFEHSRSTYEMLIAYMDWCGVEKAILMANPYYGYHNEYFIEAVQKYPGRLKGVALVDINRGKEAAVELTALYEQTPLFGMKIETNSTFQTAPGRRMTDPVCAPVWECLHDSRQTVFVHLFTRNDLEDIRTLAARYPDIVFVICHMGADACFGRHATPDAYAYLLETTKAHKNMYLDTSTVPEYFQQPYPYPAAQDVIQQGYLALGPERLMWSSDYPGMLNHATYRQLISWVAQECPGIPSHHKDMIMGQNALRLFW